MKITSFYQAWGYARATIILGFIVLTVFASRACYSWNLEMDYCGPGSEHERSLDSYRDKENADAADNCASGSCDSCDQQKGSEYANEHGA